MQVVVEEPADGGLPGVRVLVLQGAFGGVGAQQVVAAVPAGRALGEQMGAGQLGQQRADPGRVVARDGRRRGRGDVRARVQGQQPQQPGRAGAQRPVRPGEHRPYVPGRVRVGERVQAAVRGAQFVRDRGEREVGVGCGPGGNHGQGRRPGRPRRTGSPSVRRPRARGAPGPRRR
ncbi:hypothetical protein ACFZDK_12030 [Streptomyces sp. NPDC007901]|uniref:hypothetical protein n=1 Tax=Streptomyces sp. NPDC007901 TaxID=3364785 RepID=UPI0036E68082